MDRKLGCKQNNIGFPKINVPPCKKHDRNAEIVKSDVLGPWKQVLDKFRECTTQQATDPTHGTTGLWLKRNSSYQYTEI